MSSINAGVKHEYHVVELYKVDNVVLDWLVKTYGPSDGQNWFLKNSCIYFAKESHHTMFLLMWCAE
jgi:hypothetical protein